jgi:hypothetical protein
MIIAESSAAPPKHLARLNGWAKPNTTTSVSSQRGNTCVADRTRHKISPPGSRRGTFSAGSPIPEHAVTPPSGVRLLRHLRPRTAVARPVLCPAGHTAGYSGDSLQPTWPLNSWRRSISLVGLGGAPNFCQIRKVSFCLWSCQRLCCVGHGAGQSKRCTWQAAVFCRTPNDGARISPTRTHPAK